MISWKEICVEREKCRGKTFLSIRVLFNYFWMHKQHMQYKYITALNRQLFKNVNTTIRYYNIILKFQNVNSTVSVLHLL